VVTSLILSRSHRAEPIFASSVKIILKEKIM
jgi:hypothetical protein